MKNIIIAVVILMLFFSGGVFIGCKTLRVFDIEGQPQDCNDWYTTMDLVLKSGSDATTLMSLQWNRCIEARKKLDKKMAEDDKKLFCKTIIFGKNSIDKESDLYVKYIMCMDKKFYIKNP